MWWSTSGRLSDRIVRAGASASLLSVLLGGLLVVNAAPASQPDGPFPGAAVEGSGQSPWEQSYSEAYPGCVSMPLWPVDEVPVALVTRTTSGTVSRVPLDEIDRAPLSPVGRASAIGACRR